MQVEEEERKKQQEIQIKKDQAKQYRETAKNLVVYCVKLMPNSKYDKFYLAEFLKKFPK